MERFSVTRVLCSSLNKSIHSLEVQSYGYDAVVNLVFMEDVGVDVSDLSDDVSVAQDVCSSSFEEKRMPPVRVFDGVCERVLESVSTQDCVDDLLCCTERCGVVFDEYGEFVVFDDAGFALAGVEYASDLVDAARHGCVAVLAQDVDEADEYGHAERVVFSVHRVGEFDGCESDARLVCFGDEVVGVCFLVAESCEEVGDLSFEGFESVFVCGC